jgi:hypothetical protein
MRWLLGLLLVANLAMFGWWQGWFGGRNPAPPAEANPVLLRVVPIDRLGGPFSGSVPPASSMTGSIATSCRTSGTLAVTRRRCTVTSTVLNR